MLSDAANLNSLLSCTISCGEQVVTLPHRNQDNVGDYRDWGEIFTESELLTCMKEVEEEQKVKQFASSFKAEALPNEIIKDEKVPNKCISEKPGCSSTKLTPCKPDLCRKRPSKWPSNKLKIVLTNAKGAEEPLGWMHDGKDFIFYDSVREDNFEAKKCLLWEDAKRLAYNLKHEKLTAEKERIQWQCTLRRRERQRKYRQKFNSYRRKKCLSKPKPPVSVGPPFYNSRYKFQYWDGHDFKEARYDYNNNDEESNSEDAASSCSSASSIFIPVIPRRKTSRQSQKKLSPINAESMIELFQKCPECQEMFSTTDSVEMHLVLEHDYDIPQHKGYRLALVDDNPYKKQQSSYISSISPSSSVGDPLTSQDIDDTLTI